MSSLRRTTRVVLSVALLSAVRTVGAQAHAHTPGMTHPATPAPVEAGQSAFAALAEIVKLLESDPRTDWSKVNLERLRLHLADMDMVTLRTRVEATSVPGGAQFVVRGSGEVVGAVKRMTGAHAAMVAASGGPQLQRTELADGVRLVVTARDPNDATAVARIRGLGFIGLMTSGDHHGAHHLALARGDAMAGHGH
ncbi:MAG TPA: hypothetical protein VGE27_06660 [Gemmatimonas sp.]|uniref:hypothetical protein n=1 Tax=Gemmatimonas sp. TaxID=1962908 RepID=UPI002ED77CD6